MHTPGGEGLNISGRHHCSLIRNLSQVAFHADSRNGVPVLVIGCPVGAHCVVRAWIQAKACAAVDVVGRPPVGAGDPLRRMEVEGRL